MKLIDNEEFIAYIQENYKVFLRTESNYFEEFSGYCDYCKQYAFLKIRNHWTHRQTVSYDDSLPDFVTWIIECPQCKKRYFIQTLAMFSTIDQESKGKSIYDYYKLYFLPTSEIRYEIQDIPVEYNSLRKTISEANFCLDGSQFIAAAIMFRRGLQILVKDILGGKGRDLYAQIEWLRTNENNLRISLTDMFHKNSTLIRKVANQAAHPEKDITLQNFTEDDAKALHDLFLLTIYEVFVKPVQLKEMQNELEKRRKLPLI